MSLIVCPFSQLIESVIVAYVGQEDLHGKEAIDKDQADCLRYAAQQVRTLINRSDISGNSFNSCLFCFFPLLYKFYKRAVQVDIFQGCLWHATFLTQA